ncbi:Type 1 glutamine amidotransferase-like domain-containing protein [Corynebacterium halotolerans]|uniref:Type 1 glutamine amidotransferase-like domain-containing protein n=1 Tax=Corynebacterium halotolerans TaxID=225326 RepID=UPI003CFB1472
MKLLLTSFGHPLTGEFVTGTLAYVPDATRSFADQTFVHVERDMLRDHGFDLVELPLTDTPVDEVARVLDHVDGVYVAGGETFDLLWVLRSTGTFEVVRAAVLAGLPYIGCSAGSVIAGPSIEPASLLDSPAIAPALSDCRGLGLIDHVIIPHAGGNIPQYPISVFAETVGKYGADWPLVLLRDGQALLVEDSAIRLI